MTTASPSQTNPPPPPPGLVAYGRGIANLTRDKLRSARFCQAFTFITGIAAIFVPGTIGYTTAVLGLLSELLALFLRHEASALHSTSRHVMRRALLLGAHLLPADSPDIAQLKARLAVVPEYQKAARDWATSNDESTYYATRSPNPHDRLLDILYECSFWWSALAEDAARRARNLIFVAAILLLALLTLGLLLHSDRQREVLGTLIVQVGLFLLAVEVIGRYIQWKESAADARELLSALPLTPPRDLALLDIWTTDYVSLTSSCPPIPQAILSSRRSDIDREGILLVQQRELARAKTPQHPAA